MTSARSADMAPKWHTRSLPLGPCHCGRSRGVLVPQAPPHRGKPKGPTWRSHALTELGNAALELGAAMAGGERCLRGRSRAGEARRRGQNFLKRELLLQLKTALMVGSGVGEGGMKLFGVTVESAAANEARRTVDEAAGAGAVCSRSEQSGHEREQDRVAADSEAEGSVAAETSEAGFECGTEASEKKTGPLSKAPDQGASSASKPSSSRERKKGIPWTEEEHRLFLLGLSKLGKGDWRGISRKYVQSRTPTQVASHAQKYFIRQSSIHKRKRRSSLFDISADTVLGESSSMLRSASTPTLPTFPEDSPAGRPAAVGELPLKNPSSTLHPPSSSSAFALPPPVSSSTVLASSASANPLPAPPLPTSSFYNPFNRSQSYHTVPNLGSSFYLPPPAMSRPTSLPVLPQPPPPFLSESWAMEAPQQLSTWPSISPPALNHIAATSSSPLFPPSMYPYWFPPSDFDVSTMDPAQRHRLGHEMMLQIGQDLSQRMAAMAALTRVPARFQTAASPIGAAGTEEEQQAEKKSRLSRESSSQAPRCPPPQSLVQDGVSLLAEVAVAGGPFGGESSSSRDASNALRVARGGSCVRAAPVGAEKSVPPNASVAMAESGSEA